jgi:hypothetical protein
VVEAVIRDVTGITANTEQLHDRMRRAQRGCQLHHAATNETKKMKRGIDNKKRMQNTVQDYN